MLTLTITETLIIRSSTTKFKKKIFKLQLKHLNVQLKRGHNFCETHGAVGRGRWWVILKYETVTNPNPNPDGLTLYDTQCRS